MRFLQLLHLDSWPFARLLGLQHFLVLHSLPRLGEEYKPHLEFEIMDCQ